MKENEHVIINKTAILKRIDELKKMNNQELWDCMEQEVLEDIISQSTPLIPEIERAFDAGNAYCVGSHELFKQTHSNKENYISNLKLDI